MALSVSRVGTTPGSAAKPISSSQPLFPYPWAISIFLWVDANFRKFLIITIKLWKSRWLDLFNKKVINYQIFSGPVFIRLRN